MNVFELTKKFIELDNEVLELSNKLGKTNDLSERKRISTEIDRKTAEFLEIKHKMEISEI